MDAFNAIYTNDIQKLREYLATGDVNVKNEKGMSLLHSAIIFGNSQAFEALIENFIDIDIKDNLGNTPVHYCVINNRLGFLKTLIRKGANLTIRNESGESPLYKASILGRTEIIYLFLETMKFDIYETNNNDETMFMALVRSRNLDLLRNTVLDDKIVNVKNYRGAAPLHIASASGDLNVCSYLIENKAFVNIKNNDGETPLFYAVKYKNLDVIDILLKNGAIPDCKNKLNEGIFSDVDPDVMNYAFEKMIKYRSMDYKKNFPLHYSIIIEDLQMVQNNLNERTINIKDKYGYLPLEVANLINNPRILALFNNKNLK